MTRLRPRLGALASAGPAAGMLSHVCYQPRAQRAAGDALVMVTDGVTETLEADGRAGHEHSIVAISLDAA